MPLTPPRSASAKVVRRTVAVSGSAAADSARISLTLDRRYGAAVTSVERLTARLAGGLHRGIDRDALHDAVADAVQGLPENSLADLSAIASLPAALSATLAKVWSAAIMASAEEASSMRYRPVGLIVRSSVALRW